MRYFFDTEFIEDGSTIDLISTQGAHNWSCDCKKFVAKK